MVGEDADDVAVELAGAVVVDQFLQAVRLLADEQRDLLPPLLGVKVDADRRATDAQVDLLRPRPAERRSRRAPA